MPLKDRMLDFRRVDRNAYPELEGYTNGEIYDNFIGCGGLFLAVNMVRQMNLKKGDIVLDLGCGFGSSSVFLTSMFDITVIAVDLWFSPDKLLQKIKENELANRIIPLNLDITQSIPFARNYFDAVFCMNSLFLYGDKVNFLNKLLSILKPGGTICIGSECFNREPDYGSDIPEVYNFQWDWNVWESCYSKYHSPIWWKKLLNETNQLDIACCKELEDGAIYYEDFTLNYYDYLNEDILAMGSVIPQKRIADQIIYGRGSGLYPTAFVLSGTKKL